MKEARTLSPGQISEIYDFCRRKDLVYLELRMEMVDHIASKIEDLWLEKPQLSFKEAFAEVYRSFGIFGLSDIAAQQEAKVSKRFWRDFGRELLYWLRPPQVLLSLLLLAAVYFFLSGQLFIVPYVGLCLMLSVIVYSVALFRRKRALRRQLAGEQSVAMGSLNQLGWALYLAYFIPSQNIFISFGDGDPMGFLTSTKGAIFLACYLWFSLVLMRVGWRLIQRAEGQIALLQKRQALFQRSGN